MCHFKHCTVLLPFTISSPMIAHQESISGFVYQYKSFTTPW